MSAIAEPESTESGFQAGRYAAIDIGTVTCRMLVADVDEAGRLHELDREYTITNLGEGVDATGVLKPAAMQRVADAVARFLDVLRGFATPEHPAITTRAMATSAARDARNADEFEALMAGLGVTLSVIPGEREAALSFAGASCDFRGERLLVVDIGGGWRWPARPPRWCRSTSAWRCTTPPACIRPSSRAPCSTGWPTSWNASRSRSASASSGSIRAARPSSWPAW